MPSPVDLIALTLAAALPGQDAPPPAAGPSAASNEGERYDAVGYAGATEQATGAAHATLPVGSFVEVTALDSGRTVLLMIAAVAAPAAMQPIALSPDALRQLAIAPGAPVRVRTARPSPPDEAALRAGQAAPARLDAPPVLLAGLRKDLPPRGTPMAAKPAPEPIAAPKQPVAKPAPRPQQRPIDPPERQVAVQPKPQTAPASGWGVQVAALSNEANARALASRLGGRVRAAGKLYRVQLGPFADRAAAEAARAGAIRRGHAGAALVRIP
ncbi:SPOR domain-containing protein [Sphingomonas spermidinifaciens]|uniref:SPOR domain-containing protein n=1 Tax=Sphingomonas spermidinifaciens TaxID=1141889 RepID=A0A2A4B5L1_9SPHN|nr:SPOR domain-containing protein [Sphingomonas spermidinifaciens]PCD03028.1 SPOR domain-containing protein [Sphingomonas spermidinifaciens]